MTHLESVAERDAGITHWVARGPAGTRVEWDARIINEIDGKLIGWQSLEGSPVSTAGSVNFRPTSRGTEVRVHLQYNPPAGRLGAALAWLFGEEPGIQIREDLRRFQAAGRNRRNSNHTGTAARRTRMKAVRWEGTNDIRVERVSDPTILNPRDP